MEIDVKYSIDYTKVAEAESALFEAKRKIRRIDSPLPSQLWEAMEDLDRVTELLREYLSEDNLRVKED